MIGSDDPPERDRERDHHDRIRESRAKHDSEGASYSLWASALDGVRPPFDASSEATGDEERDWWSGELIPLLVIVGVLLFLFPEPATTGAGLLLVLLGGVAWIADLLR